jgi:hypothetical protein
MMADGCIDVAGGRLEGAPTPPNPPSIKKTRKIAKATPIAFSISAPKLCLANAAIIPGDHVSPEINQLRLQRYLGPSA